MIHDAAVTTGRVDEGSMAHLRAQVGQLRARLIWLSAEVALLRSLAATRTLRAHEHDALARLRSEEANLQRDLQTLQEHFDALRAAVATRQSARAA